MPTRKVRSGRPALSIVMAVLSPDWPAVRPMCSARPYEARQCDIPVTAVNTRAGTKRPLIIYQRD